MSTRAWRVPFVPAALAGCAGYVDAINFLHVTGVFPANQSGNVALFGLALGSPGTRMVPPVARTGITLACFVVGAMAGYALVRRTGTGIARAGHRGGGAPRGTHCARGSPRCRQP